MTAWKNAPPQGVNIEADVLLAPMTTMRVGGKAQFFTKINAVERLDAVVQWAHNEALPYLILGGGSNVLVSDAGVRGLVIQNRCRNIEVTRFAASGGQDPIGWDARLDPQHNPQCDQLAAGSQSQQKSGKRQVDEAAPQGTTMLVVAESGAAMAGVARTSVNHSLTGLEWAVSVPGTMGGAIVNNAGAHGGEVKDNLFETVVVDSSGDRRVLTVQELAYAYRTSSLKSAARPYQAGFEPVVLWGTFQLASAPSQEVKQRADEYLSHRRRTQPVEPSLGSMFMNPPDDFAGRLIEAAGLKGTQIGGIQVSEQHANFIVNPDGVGGGKAADVIAMIQLIQERVETKFGIALKPEIQLVGEWEYVGKRE